MINPENDTQNINERFYRAFEDRFRGSREVIKSRLKVYLPFIEPLKKIYDVCNAIDLGCGRGEWLELITESGMIAHGVDLDDGMLAACRERNLSVETGDAISFLKSLPDQSQAIISGFHIIEHIAHNNVKTLIQEAARTLKPAGLLILETPNPENITVGTSSFFLDPTHLNPIPPPLLAFMSEYYGFHRTKILRLQEPPDLRGGKLVNIADIFTGVSPDYALIAQKIAEPKLLDGFDPSFASEYGISLDAMLARYGAKEEMFMWRLDMVEVETRREISALQTQSSALQTQLSALQTQLNNIYHSRSWQITQPLRWFSTQLRLLKKDGLFVRSKAVFRRLFLRSNRLSGNSQPRGDSQKEDAPGHDKESDRVQFSQQTKRSLHTEQSPSMSGRFKQIIRSWLVSKMKLTNGHIQRMPKIKRLVLGILHRFPNLELKLRRYNQESHSESQSMVMTWYVPATNPQVPPGNFPYTSKGLEERNSSLNGINDAQRTPLEANHHKYRKSS